MSKVEQHKVSALAGLNAADLPLHAQRPGAIDRCHAEDITRGHRRRSMEWFLQERGEAHFVKHIERVIAGCTVGADADTDLLLLQPGNVRDPRAELEIR